MNPVAEDTYPVMKCMKMLLNFAKPCESINEELDTNQIRNKSDQKKKSRPQKYKPRAKIGSKP